ncbi:MAG: hypothetical protein UZ16_OP3001003319 [Candidatus Hinthialibacteria bacterium OLB16]|nr:MAG: hypothetical protein UZ16_OP3001003319 [Candidatus Hinthialibacteria bacterium OLB16]
MVGTGWFIRVKSGTHRQIRPNLESVSLSVKETISYRRPELTQKGASKLMGTCLASLFSLSDGGSEWRPEGYYALVAQSDNGKKGSILLRDISPSEQIVLNLQ